MKATLELINRRHADGIIGKYAIGGAVGATLNRVLMRYGLVPQWEKFERKYLEK